MDCCFSFIVKCHKCFLSLVAVYRQVQLEEHQPQREREKIIIEVDGEEKQNVKAPLGEKYR